MKTIIVLLLIIAIAGAAISPETTHLEDAEQVERNLVSEGYSTEEFKIVIFTENDSSNYCIAWPNYNYLDLGEAIERYKFTVLSVADAINKAKWDPSSLYVGFEDCMVSIGVQDILYVGDSMDEMGNIEIYEYLMIHSVVSSYDE